MLINNILCLKILFEIETLKIKLVKCLHEYILIVQYLC